MIVIKQTLTVVEDYMIAMRILAILNEYNIEASINPVEAHPMIYEILISPEDYRYGIDILKEAISKRRLV